MYTHVKLQAVSGLELDGLSQGVLEIGSCLPVVSLGQLIIQGEKFQKLFEKCMHNQFISLIISLFPFRCYCST